MNEVTISRAFKYNGIDLVDPNPALGPDAVREFYVPQYMELTTAVVEGPVTEDNVATYTFRRAVGTKGRVMANPNRDTLRVIARDGASQEKGVPIDAIQQSGMAIRSTKLFAIANSKRSSRAMHMPKQAFGIWG